jgi:hypothetical protein
MKRKKNQNQNPNSGTQLPKSQTSKSSTQKQNFSFESFYPNFKMQTKKLKNLGVKFAQQHLLPQPTKRNKIQRE